MGLLGALAVVAVLIGGTQTAMIVADETAKGAETTQTTPAGSDLASNHQVPGFGD